MSTLNEKDLQLIEQALDRALDPAAEAEFEARLKTDPVFRDRYLQAAAAIALLKAEAKKQLKDELRDISRRAEAGPGRNFRNRWAQIAATLAILVVASISFYFVSQKDDRPAEFQAWFSPFPAPPQVRAVSDSLLTLAFRDYRKKEYSPAAEKFNRLLKDSPGDPQLTLYLVNCHLALEETDQALNLLQSEGVNHDRVSPQHFAWYLALAWLQKNDRQKCRDQLNSIASNPGIYRDKARGLLTALEK